MVTVTTVGDLLRDAARKIDRFDAQFLLATLTGKSRASLIAHAELELSKEQTAEFQQQVAARERGVPVAQIIGRREFYGRDFAVNAHVLIPRPETELLITQALAVISNRKWLERCANIGKLNFLDLGTGSGAIAVTMALEAPFLTVWAIDQSLDALSVAKVNADTYKVRVRFLNSDWYAALMDRKFHLIVANPPYVADGDAHLSAGDLRFEPIIALTDGSADGLGAIRKIINGARAHLHDQGWLMLEHGYDQAERCRALLEQHGFCNVSSVADLAGIPRVTMGCINPASNI
jgi:release factor glutamine methyltransferase